MLNINVEHKSDIQFGNTIKDVSYTCETLNTILRL